jgi:putative DNA primase/helicase
VEAVVSTLGIAMADLFIKEERSNMKQGKKIGAIYPYHDETGNLLFECIRYIPKSFVYRRPNGQDGFLYNLNGVRRVLYRLPETIQAVKENKRIYVPEGEKCVDAQVSLGLAATCNPMGAGKWREDYNAFFKDARVVIIPDNDKPGRDHARQVARSLFGVAAEVRVLDLDGVPEKGDIFDWIEKRRKEGKSLDTIRTELETFAEQTPVWSEPDDSENINRDLDFHLTDMGNAERLVVRHGKDIRYCFPQSAWWTWTGTHWQRNEEGQVDLWAKETIRAIYAEAAEIIDDRQRAELIRHASRCESWQRRKAMIESAKSEIPVKPTDFDLNPWLLNCYNGTLDLRTGLLRSHDRDDLITKLVPVAYDPDATCPTWERFLDRIMGGDSEMITYLQRASGYSLTGSVREQCLFFLFGSGANGKSTFLNAILNLLQDYAKQAAPNLLLAKKVESHPTELADLAGVRFVATIEVEEGKRLAESLTKQLTGGDRIKARFMRENFFEFQPTFKIFLAANHKPNIRGTDYAIWRRIKLVPFEVTIPEKECDPDLPEKLREELPGILAWAVRGCLTWQKEGLKEPEKVRRATEQYRAEQDLIADFIGECCTLDPKVRIKASDLYEAYKRWCESNGEQVLTQRAFADRLTERGIARVKIGGVHYRQGMGLHLD